MRTILILCLSILFLPLTLAAEGLTVTGGAENTDYSYADNVYTVLTGTALTFSGTTTTDRIVVKERVTADIILDNVDIQFTTIDQWGDGKAAFHINKNASATITLANTNILTSNGKSSGLEVPEGTSVIIQGDGQLTATGGTSSGEAGAGIGARKNWGSGNITIQSGTIIANGGNGYSSYGGNYSGYGIGSYFGENVIINGGIIAAKGGTGAVSGNGGSILNPIINGGTLTNCSISGTKVIINKGTINNTDGSRISSKEIIINGGDITVTMPESNADNAIGDQDCNVTINGGTVNATANYKNENGDPSGAGITGTITINGGHITATASGRNGAGIGGYGSSYYGTKMNKPIKITGGIIKATGSNSIGIGTIKNETKPGNIIIEGGTIFTNGIGCTLQTNTADIIIKGGSIIGNMINSTPTNENDPVYLGITPEIANATDVSVDDVPYYISGNHPENDNKLYLYMTGTNHTITVRKNDGSVTTYIATYVSAGVDGDRNSKGYFTFDAGSTTTPSDNSAITFEAKDITTTYNKENNELKVKLTVTEKVTTRSAAMNSIQLTLTDGTNTYYSDRQTVTGSDEYTFTFDTKGLDAGNYTLTANYGGSATSLTADEQTKTLTIEKATPIYIIPSGLSVTYGKTLADINLPDGWAWNASETSVGNVSSSPKTFAATFTPADTKNYNTVVENLSITVNKAEASNPKDPEVTSSSPVTYGAKLSDITITDDWQWEDGTIVPTVSNSGYIAYYDGDYSNFDWHKIKGYNEINNRVERTVTVTVNKADPTAANFTFTAPNNLFYDGQGKQVTITLKDGLTGTSDVTLKYYNEKGESVTDPIEVGTYTVKIDVAGGDNYNSANDLNAPEWTFTILPKQYTITIDPAIANGTVTADKTQAIEGETVTLTVTPAQGYEQESLSYTTDGGTTETITGTTFVMPAADVTVTATFKASSVPPVNPPVIPDDPDDPAPVRYTITLPAVEGATTDPAAGSYEVESWGNFSFLLTLGEGYRKDSHPVVTARGETLTPNASTGKYIIPNVQSDITVGITGIVKDVATGNESLTDGFHITTSGGLLLVTVPRATRLYLTDTSGRLILSRLLPAGDTRIDDLAAGVYLLTLEGEKTKKIIIR